MTTEQTKMAIALLRGAADNHEPIEKFGADHGYPGIVIELAKMCRVATCKRTPLNEWHGSVWDEMAYAADLLDEGVLP